MGTERRHRRWEARRSVLASLTAAVLLAAGGTSVSAADFDLTDVPPDPAADRPRFQADGGSRLGPSGPEVFLAFEAPYSELFFRPLGSRFRSRFDLILLLLDGKRQVGGDLFSETIDVLDRRDARDPAARVWRVLPVAARPGNYGAQVVLRETSSGRQTRVAWKIEVPDYGSLPLSISSLWVSDTAPAGADSTLLPPAGWVLRRRFGEPLGSLAISGEVYRHDGGNEPTRLTWRVVDAKGVDVQIGETARPAGERMPFRFHPDFSALWLGGHTLEVRAEVPGHRARRRFAFQMDATAGAFSADSQQSLELIEYIATPDEMRDLREASPLARKESWNRFWKRRDPTPDTPENEFRDEFFARVRYADEQFSALGPGWRSDRGRIYIQFGPPDEVESRAASLDTPASEIWTYLRDGRRFVFVDYDGFGRYVLYNAGP